MSRIGLRVPPCGGRGHPPPASSQQQPLTQEAPVIRTAQALSHAHPRPRSRKQLEKQGWQQRCGQDTSGWGHQLSAPLLSPAPPGLAGDT